MVKVYAGRYRPMLEQVCQCINYISFHKYCAEALTDMIITKLVLLMVSIKVHKR